MVGQPRLREAVSADAIAAVLGFGCGHALNAAAARFKLLRVVRSSTVMVALHAHHHLFVAASPDLRFAYDLGLPAATVGING